MKAVILCGGLGTRIRDVPEDLPKPMIPIGERPIVWHIMKLYAHYGVDSFVLCLGYRSWSIKEYFLNYRSLVSDITIGPSAPNGPILQGPSASELQWNVSLVETGLVTQTGGRLWRIRDWVQDSDLFCVTYGDGVADIDISELVTFHKAHGKIATVTGVRPPGRFGVMVTNDDAGPRVVTEFREKPQVEEGLINGGFFVFDHRVFDYLHSDPTLVFEQEPLSSLAQDGELVMFEHHGFWQPMDTSREWKLLNELWLEGSAPWKR